MKRNELLAKSLTLGLAVATAATSMSVPGGLLAPETVYAEDGATTAEGQDRAKTQVTLMKPADLKGSWESVKEATAGEDSIAAVFNKAQFDETQTASGAAIQVNWYEGTVNKDEDLTAATKVEQISQITKAGVYSYVVACAEDADYTSDKLFGIIKVGKDLGEAAVTLKDGENETTSFSYTGRAVKPTVEVTGVDSTNYVVSYKDEAGNPIEAPSEIGTYKVVIKPSDVGAGVYYGSVEKEFSIVAATAVKVTTTEELKKYLKYEDATFEYTGENQWDFNKRVEEQAGYEEEEFDWDISVQQNGKEVDFINAGTYDVYVELTGKTISTDGYVKIGTAVINPYKTKAGDIYKVTGYDATYGEHSNDEVWYWWNGPLDRDLFTVKFLKIKDGNGNPVENADYSTEYPENVGAGVYQIYLDYEGDSNTTSLENIDTGKQIVIKKKTETVVVGQKVVNNSTGTAITIDLRQEASALPWNEVTSEPKFEITEGKEYLVENSLKYENGKITVELDPDKIKDLQQITNVKIRVDFKDSFKNYDVAAFDIPIVITSKEVVNITIANVTNGIFGTYRDTDTRELKFTISNSLHGDLKEKTDFEISEVIKGKADTSWGFEITDLNGTKTNIEYAGKYKVHATYYDGTYYGETTEVIVVEPKKLADVNNGDFDGILILDMNPLTYNFENQIEAIKQKVKLAEGLPSWRNDVKAGDYDIIIRYGDSDTIEAEAAGWYEIWIAFKQGNYVTDGPVFFSSMPINKATLNLSVAVDSKGTLTTVKAGDYVIPNDWVDKVEYYQGETKLDAQPTAPGTYKVKVTYEDEDNLTAPATGEATFTISGSSSGGNTSGGSSSGGSSSGGSSAGGGAATTPAQDDKKDDTTKTETKPDGTTVTTTETKAEDGSVQTKIELKNDATGVDATVNVTKDAQGKVTGVTAEATQKSSDQKTEISAATVAQITEAAGTKDVEITTKTVDADGKTVREVTVNASDLTAGKKLKVVAVDPKTGEKTLVNKTTYKVAANGSLVLDDLGDANYEVVTTSEANALSKEVLKTIKPAKPKATVAAGKKARLTLDDALNMDNVAKITYRTSKKSVATVNSNGMITTQKEGKVTIKAIVTLNNGKKKTVRMSLTVKKKK